MLPNCWTVLCVFVDGEEGEIQLIHPLCMTYQNWSRGQAIPPYNLNKPIKGFGGESWPRQWSLSRCLDLANFNLKIWLQGELVCLSGVKKMVRGILHGDPY